MEDRACVKKYHDIGVKPYQIYKALKQLKITKNMVYRTVKRLKETGSIANRPRSGRPRTVRTPQFIKNLKRRLKRNPQRSVRAMAKNPELRTSRSTLRRAVHDDLRFHAFKKGKSQGLTRKSKVKRFFKGLDYKVKYKLT
jgi:transposase